MVKTYAVLLNCLECGKASDLGKAKKSTSNSTSLQFRSTHDKVWRRRMSKSCWSQLPFILIFDPCRLELEVLGFTGPSENQNGVHVHNHTRPQLHDESHIHHRIREG